MILNLTNLEESDIKYKIQKFPDGQQNIVIESFIYKEWQDAIINNSFKVQIKSRLNNWLDLELIVCAVASLREIGIDEIQLYVPYIMGARSDRKFEEGGNNYLKRVICPIINSLNFNLVTCIDPHSDVLEACINNFKPIKQHQGLLPHSHMTLLEKSLSLIYFGNDYSDVSIKDKLNNFILVSPDAGASKKIYKLADKIGYKGDIITCSKERDTEGKLTQVNVPIGFDKFTNDEADFIIIDDICDGGATFINIAENLKKRVKGKIYLIITHGIFSKGFKELDKYFDGIYCTNSYSNWYPEEFREGKNVKQINVF